MRIKRLDGSGIGAVYLSLTFRSLEDENYNMGKIYVVGIGAGAECDITPAAREAIAESSVVVGYHHYFRFIEGIISGDTKCVDTGMKQETQRAEQAFNLAEQGETVAVISSGDAGIYGMAPLIWEMKERVGSSIEVEVIPGISAFQKAASILGAPIGHDMCIISLSDLMTPWRVIERRIKGAAYADFVTAIYNPKSKGRYWQLHRLKEIFLEDRSPETPVGYVRNAGRDEQQVTITTLGKFDPEQIDMFTVVIIGNSQSYIADNGSKIITPRGYYRNETNSDRKIGQQIMTSSFSTIEGLLKNPNIELGRKWAMLHLIHTTADFEMEDLLYTDSGAVELLHKKLVNGEIKTIITDVTMALSGIRKGALERLNIEPKCYLHDPRVAEMATKLAITRTQAGIRLAIEEHPDALYIFGNAPTALLELCSLMRKGKATPAGVVAAPVGFVNVEESKHAMRSFLSTPKLVVNGRKGGSSIAATLVNALLTLDDAEAMKPGRDL